MSDQTELARLLNATRERRTDLLMSSQEPFNAREFAGAYLAAWNRRDEVALRSYFTPEAQYREIALKKSLEGVDDIIGFMRHLQQAFPDVRWDVIDVVADSGNKLAIQWMSRRTIDGTPNEAEGVSFMHLRNGRITLNADFRHRGQ